MRDTRGGSAALGYQAEAITGEMADRKSGDFASMSDPSVRECVASGLIRHRYPVTSRSGAVVLPSLPSRCRLSARSNASSRVRFSPLDTGAAASRTSSKSRMKRSSRTGGTRQTRHGEQVMSPDGSRYPLTAPTSASLPRRSCDPALADTFIPVHRGCLARVGRTIPLPGRPTRADQSAEGGTIGAVEATSAFCPRCLR